MDNWSFDDSQMDPAEDSRDWESSWDRSGSWVFTRDYCDGPHAGRMQQGWGGDRPFSRMPPYVTSARGGQWTGNEFVNNSNSTNWYDSKLWNKG